MLGAASARKSADKAIGWADINNASVWYAAWMREIWRCLADHGSLWVFGNWRSFPVYQCAASKIPGMSILSVVVWDKEWPSVGSMRGLRQNYELIVLFGKPSFAIRERNISDIWKCKWTSAKPTGHPQEKPVKLIDRILDVSGLPDVCLVIDPFLGSGSVGVAAVSRGHRFIGIEMDENHLAIAEARIRSARAEQPLFA
jgi:site-specific DNA-methyltransferase (adenine-specific)